jgi:hypothetical protein
MARLLFECEDREGIRVFFAVIDRASIYHA